MNAPVLVRSLAPYRVLNVGCGGGHSLVVAVRRARNTLQGERTPSQRIKNPFGFAVLDAHLKVCVCVGGDLGKWGREDWEVGNQLMLVCGTFCLNRRRQSEVTLGSFDFSFYLRYTILGPRHFPLLLLFKNITVLVTSSNPPPPYSPRYSHRMLLYSLCTQMRVFCPVFGCGNLTSKTPRASLKTA